MKSNLEILNIDSLIDFQDSIGNVLYYLQEIEYFIPRGELKRFNKTYDYLENLWDISEEIIVHKTDNEDY